MNSKAITWGTIILVVIFIFLWITVYIEKPVEAPVVPAPVVTTPVTTANPVYADPSGYTVSYPEGYTIAASSDNELFAKGVSFIIPRSFTEGTNLSTDSRIYIEAKQGTSTCSALVANVGIASSEGSVEATETFGSNTYRAITYSEAGAGNFYETNVYAIKKGDACYEITQFIHSTNIGNYDPGTVTAFDREPLDKAIRIVLESFRVK